MEIRMIYACARDGVIGRDNAMPWHLPEDLAHFRRQTRGAAVVMGRKTWESLPARFRPLPGRCNIVVSRQPHWQPGECASTDPVQHATSLEQAFALGRAHGGPVWVIGGAQLYAQAEPLASSIHITEIDMTCAGDAFAPALGPHWQEVARSRHVSSTGLAYQLVQLQRAPGTGAKT